MKKNRNLVKISIVASLLITTSSILGQNVEVMASNPTNYKDMTEYAAYENVIADAGAISGDFSISVALYDIDQDARLFSICFPRIFGIWLFPLFSSF